MPDAPLTPDRIREALLLLQAREEADARGGLPLVVGADENSEGYEAWLMGPEGEAHKLAWSPTTPAEALTGLLEALGTEPWEWPSEDELRVFRTQFSADEDDVLRVLAGFFAAEPLMVLGLLVKLGGRDG